MRLGHKYMSQPPFIIMAVADWIENALISSFSQP